MKQLDPTDLLGKVFTRLTVLEVGEDYISPTGLSKKHPRYWCQCECGVRKLVRRDSLIKGNSKSCGCLAKEQHAIHSGALERKLRVPPRFRRGMSDHYAARYSQDF